MTEASVFKAKDAVIEAVWDYRECLIEITMAERDGDPDVIDAAEAAAQTAWGVVDDRLSELHTLTAGTLAFPPDDPHERRNN